jgi:hypothetical protein
VALSLASGVPLVCYLATASAHAYWLDGGEFVATSVGLGIAHPPGHPLASLVGSLATLLPLGPVALRVALASAVCAAAAAACLFRAIETTVRSLGIASNRIAIPLALGATWLVAGSYGWWFQAVRPEVYALEALLLCYVIERVIALEAAWPTLDTRPLVTASLALGLALANHHFLAFLVLPAIAPTLARVKRAHGWRPLVYAGVAVATGLTTYLYLPLRASANPVVNVGDPSSPERFYWVVSAQVFQKNTGTQIAQPMWERFADVAVQLVENLHWFPVLLALAGAYVVLRTPGTRRVGTIWVVLLLVFFAARAWLGFVRSNPDALGYLMPAFGAVGALAAAFIAALLTLLGGAGRRRPSWIAVLVAVVLGGLGLAQIKRSVEPSSLARFSATDDFDEIDYRALPPRAVLFLYAPQTVFRVWGATAAGETRPDVTVVPIPFVDYPGMANQLTDREPALREVLRSYLLEGQMRTSDLQNLAATRPVLVELDPRVQPELFATMVPSEGLHEVLGDAAYAEDRGPAAEMERRTWQRLDRLLGSRRLESETRDHLLWRAYMSALFHAGVGDRPSARLAVHRALSLSSSPPPPELVALQDALGTPPESSEGGEDSEPLDVRPFLPH